MVIDDTVFRIFAVMLSIVIESIGIAVTCIGIIVERKEHAPFGHFLITLGACIIAVGSVLFAKIMSFL